MSTEKKKEKNETRHHFAHALWRQFWQEALEHGMHKGTSNSGPRWFISETRQISKSNQWALDALKAAKDIYIASRAIEELGKLKGIKLSSAFRDYAISSTEAGAIVGKAEAKRVLAMERLLDMYDDWVRRRFAADFQQAYFYDVIEQG